MVATSSHKGTPLDETEFSGPMAVFVGNEGAGLPRDLMAEMDEVVAIPHAAAGGVADAGVAASIVLYEVARKSRIATEARSH